MNALAFDPTAYMHNVSDRVMGADIEDDYLVGRPRFRHFWSFKDYFVLSFVFGGFQLLTASETTVPSPTGVECWPCGPLRDSRSRGCRLCERYVRAGGWN